MIDHFIENSKIYSTFFILKLFLQVFFAPQYTPGNADFDYSLLRLDRPLPIGRNIAVLNLPARDYGVDVDDILIVSGWGSIHVGCLLNCFKL